jgi:transcriptional regulator with XRE-family HTH domain
VPPAVRHLTEDINVGAIIRRMRRQRGFSLEELATASEVSASFLGAVELGASDISVGRLASAERVAIDRGPGVDYRHLRLPEVDFELVTVTIPPRTAFKEALTHPGIEILDVIAGEIVLTYDGVEYPMAAGETGVWSGMHLHTYRNDGDEAAQFVAVATETIWDR